MQKNDYLEALGITQWQQRIYATTTDIKVILIASTLNKNHTLLKSMIKSMSLTLDEIYIEDSLTSLNQKMIDLSPALLIAMGEHMTQQLLQTDAPLDAMRNIMHSYGKEATALIASYHPDDLIKHPIDKKKAFSDLRLAQKLLNFCGK